MKKLICALALGLATNAYAHDEGHGPKSTGVRPNKGGIVSAVVKKSDASKGSSAEGVYWAELIRRTDGTAQVFVYKKEANAEGRLVPLDLQNFEKKGTAELQAKVKGKWKNVTFNLDQSEGSFVGKMPKAEGKPYNIDVTVKESGNELLTAFDNLD